MSVTMELPDINAIILCGRDHHAVFKRIENSVDQRVCVANEGLEVIRHRFLCLVIPNLKQVVLPTGEHKATILS